MYKFWPRLTKIQAIKKLSSVRESGTWGYEEITQLYQCVFNMYVQMSFLIAWMFLALVKIYTSYYLIILN